MGPCHIRIAYYYPISQCPVHPQQQHSKILHHGHFVIGTAPDMFQSAAAGTPHAALACVWINSSTAA